MNKDIFCAKEQKVTSHKASVDGNGEFLFECETPDCGRFIKFPADTTPEQFDIYIKAHEESNTGQVSLEEQEKKLAELLGIDTNENATPVQPNTIGESNETKT
jgi:uncharacterized Zn finger protein